MCLAVPVRILSVSDDGNTARGESLGVTREISLEMLDEDAAVGDYVLLHVGFAIRKVDVEIAKQTLADHLEMARRMNHD